MSCLLGAAEMRAVCDSVVTKLVVGDDLAVLRVVLLVGASGVLTLIGVVGVTWSVNGPGSSAGQIKGVEDGIVLHLSSGRTNARSPSCPLPRTVGTLWEFCLACRCRSRMLLRVDSPTILVSSLYSK